MLPENSVPIVFDSPPASPDVIFTGSEADDDSDDPVIKLMRRKLDEGQISRDEYVALAARFLFLAMN